MIRTTGILLGLVLCTPSWAADLPGSAPLHSPLIYSWTGFYAGVNAGFNQNTTDPTTSFTDPNGIISLIIDAGALALPRPQSGSGFLGGGQIGYNFQTGGWLVGIESDLAGSTTKSSETQIGTPLPFTPIIATTLTQRLSALGTTRARLGVVSDHVLFYGTGGLAYGQVEDTLFVRDTLDPTANFSSARSGFQLGWTAGGGVEFGIDRWTAKFEYLYYDLGNRSSVALASANTQLPGAFAVIDQSTRGQIFRVGLNYRFMSSDALR